MVPAFTVKSSAATITGRPSMRPEPMTMRVGGQVGPADERAELLERPRIEEVVDARTRVELPGRAVLGEPLLATHRARGAAVTQIVERRFPLVGAATIVMFRLLHTVPPGTQRELKQPVDVRRSASRRGRRQLRAAQDVDISVSSSRRPETEGRR